MPLLPNEAAAGSHERREVTKILEQWNGGTADALDRLIPIVFDRIREIARGYANKYKRDGADPTLEPNALANEAFLKLNESHIPVLKNREEFYAYCSRVIRNIAIDYFRGKQADKRGGDVEHVRLGDLLDLSWVKRGNTGSPDDILTLHEVLARLKEKYPRPHQVVDLKFFAELPDEEIADCLNIAVPTVQRDWKFARAWIRREISQTTSKIFEEAKKIDSRPARAMYLETACGGNPSLQKDVELLLKKKA